MTALNKQEEGEGERKKMGEEVTEKVEEEKEGRRLWLKSEKKGTSR